jgi:serine/threonine protein kinase/Flp pilus assembly protein TadD
MLPALQALHAPAEDQPPSADGPAAEIVPEGPLGDFRLVREIGRGGMGVVYEAVQISLGRRVALKVLPFAAGLDARQLQRFKNEAQAVAHLHHPHIVPVYYVGCERGVHFYAMQLIEGRTLAALIRELRQTAGPEERGSRVEGRGSKSDGPAPLPAERTETREDRGPAVKTDPRHLRSSILDPRSSFFRTAARLVLQAAEALEHAHRLGVIHRDVKPANLLVDTDGKLWVTDFGLARLPGDKGLTGNGDLLGTLRYMSPEQALGHPAAVDQRTDVYSLGATLYEVLTLGPALDGRDRQELLRRIAAEEPHPVRQLNPAVPTELEVIVRKALEKEPKDRYATAQELADDLRRFLEDKPIRARRPSWREQARKWARRHRPVVWSAAAALFVTLTVVAGSVGWVVRDQAAREDEAARDREARRARNEAKVRGALEEGQRLRGQGKWLEAQAAARRAEELLADGGGSAELRGRAGGLRADLRMVLRLEEIQLLQSGVKDGRFDDLGADRRYAAAFRRYGVDVESLGLRAAAARLRERPIRVELATALDGWSQTRRYLPGRGRKGWQELLALARAVDPDLWRRRFRGLLLRGKTQALAQAAATVQVRRLPPVTLRHLAGYLQENGRPRRALALLRRAQQQYPGDFWINHQLAYYLDKMQPHRPQEVIRFYTAAVAIRPDSPGALLNFGNALAGAGRNQEALAAYRRACGVKPDYADAYNNLGNILWALGRQDEALAAYRRALRLNPSLGPAHGNLGNALCQQGHLNRGLAELRQAVALMPTSAVAHCNLGLALADRGRPGEALAECRAALRLDPDYAEAHDARGRALLDLGRPGAAAAAFRRTIRLQPSSAAAQSHLGVALGRLSRPAAALAAYRRAIQLQPDNAEAHCNLGTALGRQGLGDEAIAAYRRAVRLKPDLVPAHFNLGLALTAQGRFDQAVAALRRAIALKPVDPLPHYDLGNALWGLGRLDAAVDAYRRAIALKPDYAEAHCNLGDALRHQGKFARALAAYRRGHAVGSRRPHWTYPSARWLRRCRRQLELAARLTAVLRGEAAPATAAERSEYGEVCYYQQLYVAAARLWADAFRADPKLAEDVKEAYRYHAACAAARAGGAAGKGGEKLTDTERARWRRQALAWLRADLVLRARQLGSGKAKDRREVRQKLRHWQWDSNLAGLRDREAMARLPADEQQVCKQLWGEVKALLAKADTAR